MTPRTDDTADVVLAKAGDEAAFARLRSRHLRLVGSVCLGILHDFDAAEDAGQEVWLQVWRKLSTFRGESKFSTWVHCVARSVCLMRLRAKKGKPGLVSLDDIIPENGRVFRDTICTDDSAVRSTPDRVTVQRMLAEMAVTAPGYAEHLRLYYLDGLEHTEIAARCGTSIGNVKSQTWKARGRARQMLTVAASAGGR